MSSCFSHVGFSALAARKNDLEAACMFKLFKTIGLGLMAVLPFVNPLTNVAFFLSLSKNMSAAERN